MYKIPDLILKELPLYRSSVQVVTDYAEKQKIRNNFFFLQQLIEDKSENLSYHLYDKNPDNFDISEYINNFFLSEREIILCPLDDNDDLNFAIKGCNAPCVTISRRLAIANLEIDFIRRQALKRG